MANNKEKHHIILGAILGGLIGGAALFLLRGKEKSHLNKLGEAISEMGEILKEDKDEGEALEQIEKAIPHGEDIVHSALSWIATGLSLWKRFKRGM
jgi:gas vesicle protein